MLYRETSKAHVATSSHQYSMRTTHMFLAKRISHISSVYTAFTFSIFVSALGLFGLSLFDIRQRYREIAIRKVNGAQLKNLYSVLFRKYIWVIAGAALLTIPLSYYLIYIYTRDFIVKAPVSIFIYLIAILVVAGISLGTLFWQVNKATRINPATIMKAE